MSCDISLNTVIAIYCYSVYFMISESADSEFAALSDCTRPGHDQIFECTVVGEGATIWKGTAFDCVGTDNEIVLLHASSSSSPLQCNDGAIQGRIVRAINNTYTHNLQWQLLMN